MNELIKKTREGIVVSVGVIVIVAAIVLAVYAAVGAISDTGRHILATALVFTTIGAYLLGLQYAKSHRAGIERGIDLKIGAHDRTQPARPVAMAQPTPAQRFDHLLPRVDHAVIVTRTDDDTSPIDL